MGLIDLILNLAALLLWLNWRAINFATPSQPLHSLLSTLKKVEQRPSRRWIYLAGLLGLLLFRSFFYWHIGSAVNWTPNLQLSAISLPFRSDYAGRMLLFSVLSFGWVLAGFYLWLLLLAMANRRLPAADPLQRLVRMHLGWFARWPALLQLLLPLIAVALFWFLANPSLVRLGIIPAKQSPAQLWQQAALLGVGSLLAWKYLIIGVLGLHLLNSYVYLGNYAFWFYVNATGRFLLRPLEHLPLRLGKADFAPFVGIIVVWLVAEFGAYGLTRLYQRLPF